MISFPPSFPVKKKKGFQTQNNDDIGVSCGKAKVHMSSVKWHGNHVGSESTVRTQ